MGREKLFFLLSTLFIFCPPPGFCGRAFLSWVLLEEGPTRVIIPGVKFDEETTRAVFDQGVPRLSIETVIASAGLNLKSGQSLTVVTERSRFEVPIAGAGLGRNEGDGWVYYYLTLAGSQEFAGQSGVVFATGAAPGIKEQALRRPRYRFPDRTLESAFLEVLKSSLLKKLPTQMLEQIKEVKELALGPEHVRVIQGSFPDRRTLLVSLNYPLWGTDEEKGERAPPTKVPNEEASPPGGVGQSPAGTDMPRLQIEQEKRKEIEDPPWEGFEINTEFLSVLALVDDKGAIQEFLGEPSIGINRGEALYLVDPNGDGIDEVIEYDFYYEGEYWSLLSWDGTGWKGEALAGDGL